MTGRKHGKSMFVRITKKMLCGIFYEIMGA